MKAKLLGLREAHKVFEDRGLTVEMEEGSYRKVLRNDQVLGARMNATQLQKAAIFLQDYEAERVK